MLSKRSEYSLQIVSSEVATFLFLKRYNYFRFMLCIQECIHCFRCFVASLGAEPSPTDSTRFALVKRDRELHTSLLFTNGCYNLVHCFWCSAVFNAFRATYLRMPLWKCRCHTNKVALPSLRSQLVGKRRFFNRGRKQIILHRRNENEAVRCSWCRWTRLLL